MKATDRRIREYLIKHMVKNGMTQTELAQELGMKKQQFNSILNARRGIGQRVIDRIVHKLSITEAELTGEVQTIPDEEVASMHDELLGWKEMAKMLKDELDVCRSLLASANIHPTKKALPKK
jgi:transcriptional regulator with XRE-family HTH domain